MFVTSEFPASEFPCSLYRSQGPLLSFDQSHSSIHCVQQSCRSHSSDLRVTASAPSATSPAHAQRQTPHNHGGDPIRETIISSLSSFTQIDLLRQPAFTPDLTTIRSANYHGQELALQQSEEEPLGAQEACLRTGRDCPHGTSECEVVGACPAAQAT